MSKVIIGTELKLNVNVKPIDDKTMDEYDFEVQLRGGKQTISLKKEGDTLSQGLSKGDDPSNYIVAFDTQDLGLGKVVCRVIAYLPDGAFKDRKRTEIAEINTGIEVVKTLV